MFGPISAYGIESKDSKFVPINIERRELTDYDVEINILYCGVNRDDHNDNQNYPIIPGNEIVGIVANIGGHVTKFQIGDKVGVGSMVDSCRHCKNCNRGQEQYCLNGGPTWTYNSKERLSETEGRTLKLLGEVTYGGYSTMIVVQEHFVFKLPDNLDLARSAPLLTAGIAIYYPLRYWNIGRNSKIAIAGIGAVGHLGIKFAKALGSEVVALTTSPDKIEHIKKLGADDIVLMDKDYIDFLDALDKKEKLENNDFLTNGELSLLANPNLKSEYRGYFDMIISTIPVSHDITPYLQLLKPDGNLHILGNSKCNFKSELKSNITFSKVGGTHDTREMLQFCSMYNTDSDIKIIHIDQLNEIQDKNPVHRYVIDMSTLLFKSKY